MVLWEVLGTLPSLADLTLLALKAIDTASHFAHVSEKSHRQSEGPKYFDALEKLNVTGPFFLIQHLLGFIDSQCLKRLEVFADDNRVRNNHEADDLFTPSMTIATSKWSVSEGTSCYGSKLKWHRVYPCNSEVLPRDGVILPMGLED